MPTVHREAGFKFVIYFDDHEPAHVHVWHVGTVARISIGDVLRGPSVADPGTMGTPLLRQAIQIAVRQQAQFIDTWRRIHGS